MRLSILLGLVVLIGLSGCEAREPLPERRAEIPFRADGTLAFLRNEEELVRIDIEIAETDSARARGLMERASLPPQSGMLFIFDREEPQSFWMANTPLSLDMFFVGADSGIVRIAKYTRPLSPTHVSSDAPARYVVETPAGFADTHGIVETDRVTWHR
jgi:uncharacterized protein